MDDGIRCVWLEAALRRMITVWRKNTARAIRKHKDPSALLSPLLYFDVTQWSFCAALLQVKPTYCLSAEHMANARGEGWAHSELREPRGERTDFHSVDVNYTFELIDKIDLSPSPTAHIHILCKQSLLIVRWRNTAIHIIFFPLNYVVITRSFLVITRSFLVITRSFLVITRSFLVITRSFLVKTTYFLVITRSFLVKTTYFLVITRYFLVKTSYFLVITRSFLVKTTYFLVITRSFLVKTTYFSR